MQKNTFLKWILPSLLIGLATGVSTHLLLVCLIFVTQTRQAHPQIIWLLPFAGLFLAWLYQKFGKDISQGIHLVFEEFHKPQKKLPFKMAPLVLIGNIVTQLFGGSAGREGTAVQMSAALADQIGSFFKVATEDRKVFLMAGAGAGFGTTLGAPLAGFIFGMEVMISGKIQFKNWLPCLLSSFFGFITCQLLKTPHTLFPNLELKEISLFTFLCVFLAGISFALAGRIFIWLTYTFEKLFKRLIKHHLLIPFIGGILITLLFYAEGSMRYVGLGIPVIIESLQIKVSFLDPLFKTFFTSLTLASGFKGGEFIPLIFIGTTLGSALSVVLPVSITILSAVGFGAVFAGAANTPIACAVMVSEIFGWQLFPLALVACYSSYLFSKPVGIYKNQLVAKSKLDFLSKLIQKN